MRTMIKRMIACGLALCLLSVVPYACAAKDGFDYSYTYTYDIWGDIRESPDPYRVQTVINSVALGLETPMRAPQGLFVCGDKVYICDTGNNRILEVLLKDNGFELLRIIDSFQGAASPLTFSAPYDIFVNDAGEMFICDMNNRRVLKLDGDLNLLREFTKPDDSTFDQNLSFLPTKLVADTVGRVFVLGKNVNKGLIKYESDGTFAGFIGANEVKFNWVDYLWKTVFATAEQRAQQVSFVPTEYDNITLDRDGFFYAVTNIFSEEELIDLTAKPIRRLNALGADILIRNGEYPPLGDLQWDDVGEYTGPSKFADVTVMDNNIYVGVDNVRCRLFGYDEQGRLLWAFGGVGNRDGFFLKPTAIGHRGYELLVLDAQECSVTILTPTEYGQMIYTATEEYQRGEYEKSATTWQDVLLQNGNYDLAYIGIGRALLRQDRYEEAMAYFRVPRDWRNYADAFKLYRKEWVEEHIVLVFSLVALVLVVPPILRRAKKIREEVARA